MRLPSHSYDTLDLVRNMSIPADGPEQVITADEYLHPQTLQLGTSEDSPQLLAKYPTTSTEHWRWSVAVVSLAGGHLVMPPQLEECQID